MKFRYLNPTQISCFSPPVMVTTFVIEIVLAAFVMWKYKLNDVTRLAVMILLLLATFQIAEYNVCEGSFGIDSLTWSRIGFIAISFLPPLGFHLATKIARQHKYRPAVALAYLGGLGFALFFAFSGQGIVSQVCLGNYVIFDTMPGSGMLYGVYYYGWLIAGTTYSFIRALQIKEKNRSMALIWLAIGYLSFIMPTTFVNLVNPSTLAGIPSIMCGFAVILAIVLVGKVLPEYYSRPKVGAKVKAKTKSPR